MAEPVRHWDGAEWQEHCLSLLRLRYRHDLQEIPSLRKPDLGIEAYSHDAALYQCYAAQEPLSTADLYAAQRDKLTRDLGKLETNQAELAALLGDIEVRRYLFIVPRFEGAELPTHASLKSQQVRARQLAFIASDFQVVVMTDESFPSERAQLIALGAANAGVVVPDIQQNRINAWTAANEAWLENLVRKIGRLTADGPRQADMQDRLLTHYLAGESMLGQLRDESPEVWESLEAGRNARMNLLATERAFDLGTPATRFTEVRDRERDQYAELPGIDASTAEHLAWGTTAEWLLECSLDFPGQD